MSAPGYVDALWVGSFEGVLPSGKVLVPGVTTHEISEGEAEASDHWRPVASGGPVWTPPEVNGSTSDDDDEDDDEDGDS